MTIYLVAIPLTQVFLASWFGPVTCAGCQWNNSWGFVGVEIQWEADGSFFHVKWGWMEPALLRHKRSKADQVTSPILTAKKWPHFWVFEIFQPPRWEALFPTPEKNSVVSDFSVQFTSSPSVMLFAGSLPGGPGFLQATMGPAGQARAGFPLHLQHGNAALWEKGDSVPGFPAAPRGRGQKPCCI